MGVERSPRALGDMLAIGDREALRYLKGERIPAAPILARIEVTLGATTAWLVGQDSPATGPGVPQASRSPGSPPLVAIREPGLSYAKQASGPAVAAWLALGAEMQHNLAVKVIKEALEAQDFAGSPVLRALHGIAQKMDEMGYTAMSRHIWAEMGKYFGQQLPPEGKP